MTRYLMSVCYPADSTAPAPAELEAITRDVTEVHRQLEAEGAWVFGGGLHDPSTATVVTSRDGSAVTTDGPFVETKEVIDVGHAQDAHGGGDELHVPIEGDRCRPGGGGGRG